MSYSCRLYQNSGFNIVNIPDSPELLDLCEYVDVPTLDIMQERGLSQIRVKATWSQVKNADYIKLSDSTSTWFYSIQNTSMAATDVCILSVTPDYILSAGGVSSLTILDGITDRVCVADDTFGAYKQNDPYLTPAETPQVLYANIDPAAYSNGNYDLVETTIDLIATGTNQTAVTYTDPDTDETVTVPQTVDAPQSTTYIIGETTAPDIGTTIYDGSKDDIKTGITRARGIVENPVLKHVTIPGAFVQGYKADTADSLVTHIDSKWWSIPCGLEYSYATVKNNRVLYGEFNKYGLITATGAKCEFNPEDIYDSTGTSPNVDEVADPHLDGKPYYRFETVDGSNDFQTRRFFVGAAAGAQWSNVPQIYTEKAGNAFDTLQYNYSMESRHRTYDNMARGAALSTVQNALGLGGVNVTTTQESGSDWAGVSRTSINPIGGVLGLSMGIVSAGENYKSSINALENYSAATQMEAARYLANTGAYMPQIAIPYNTNLFRDFYGNGALVYRYRYTTNDIARLDRILTMYGYKYTKALEASDFTNRTHFNYIQSSISVTGLPKWWNDGISAQLSAGTRVWHELPNATAYDDNPIVTA